MIAVGCQLNSTRGRKGFRWLEGPASGGKMGYAGVIASAGIFIIHAAERQEDALV